jgi:4-amino-4-deoxy-L-arabinose transferase-like glycosyltransferase
VHAVRGGLIHGAHHTTMDRPALRGMILLICWAIGSTIVGRSFTALDPYPFDAQLFAYVGLQWLHGHIPYVNIWDNKPPGIFAVNALVFLLFPKSFTALAWMEGIFILGCIGSAYLLMRQWGGPWLVAALTTASVAVASNLLYYNEHGNLTEIYMLWPATLSMYCFSKASPTFQGKWIFLAGLFSGVVALFKPPGLSPMFAQGAFLFLLWAAFRQLSLQRILAAGFVTGVGALVAWLPAAWYFWRHNAFGELVYASWTYNIFYGAAAQPTIPFAARNAISRLQLLTSLVVCVIAGLMLYVRLWAMSRRSREPEDKIGQAPCFWWPLALLWFVFDLAGALAGGRNYPHYFLPLTVSLSVVAGVTYWSFMESIPNQARWWGIDKALFGLIVGPLIFAQVSDVRQMRSVLSSSEHPAPEPWEAVSAHLNAIRSPSDTLFMWDYLPRIYFATEMKSPTRLLDAHHIFDSAQSRRKFEEEIVQGLKRAPPTFIVDGWRTVLRERRWAGDPVYRRFREFLENHYARIYTADNFRLYKYQSYSELIRE